MSGFAEWAAEHMPAPSHRRPWTKERDVKPQLNHLIVWSRDRRAAAAFFAEVLGLGAPTEFGHFTVVETGNGVSIDFGDGEPNRMHLALLVTEREFDEIFQRIRSGKISFWADPRRSRPGQINRKDGGRGLYFSDPHTRVGWEVLTRPYGSGPIGEAAQ